MVLYQFQLAGIIYTLFKVEALLACSLYQAIYFNLVLFYVCIPYVSMFLCGEGWQLVFYSTN